VILFRVNEVPNFIDLDPLARELRSMRSSGASAAGVDDKLSDGVLAGTVSRVTAWID